MKKLFVFFLLLYSDFLLAQMPVITTVASFPGSINESSGLEMTDTLGVWTHNDSGGKNRIYKVNFSGVTIDSITISNATNVDWEDIARDADSNLYVGDFGNNSNSRKDLKIYKIQKRSLITGNTTTASIISFSYSDQTAFPPGNGNLNYDVEGFFHAGDSLYLFSKNRSTVNSSGYTKMYRLPDDAGNYTAELIDSFYAGANETVTAADISDDGSSMALLTYFSIWVFKNYSRHDFFSVTPDKYSITNATQKEGIVFKNNHQLYISDEKVGSVGGNIYLAELGITTGVNAQHKCRPFFLYPNPCSTEFGISFSDMSSGEQWFTIRNISGRIMRSGMLTVNNGNAKINCADLSEGEYFFETKNFSQPFLLLR